MRIYKSPQYSTNARFEYVISGEIITATLVTIEGRASDIFDFTSFPDGELDIATVITSLPLSPILSAKRVNGVLSVSILNYINESSSVQEKYPEWVVV